MNTLSTTSVFKKTVVVLDRNPQFSSHSKVSIDLDGGFKTKGSSKSQSLPIYKSIWTCMVEASVEYCRVVYDLFPAQNLVRLIVSDTTSHPVNSWAEKDQCVSQVLKPLAALRSNAFPDSEEEFSITHGLTEAVRSFVTSISQKKRVINETDNKGRIICLTSFASDSDLDEAVKVVGKAFKSLSESTKSNSSSPLHYIDLVFIHIPRGGDGGKISERTFKPMSNISVSVQIMKASQLVTKMTSLVQRHFNLKSTIVTGIPMKEEQHAGGPINYDVELYHLADVHYEMDMFNIYCTDISGPCELSQRHEILKDTVTLRWCTTPKASNNLELQHCLGAFRFTVAEVNSRPAACLVSFLLQGKNVLLEQPKKSGNKVISHVLTSHAGDLYIHCIGNNRCPLEDPPSISEGCGGRVTDYRINDFGEFMKSNRLAPLSGPKPKGVIPLEKATSRLERCTRIWPMVISDTLLFNLIAHLEPLTTIIFKEHLTDEDVKECTKAINRLQAMESRNDPLPVSSVGFRGKGPKRDEQYRQLWAEMEAFLQSTSTTSKMHAKVYNYLRGEPENDEDNSNDSSSVHNENDEVSRISQAWKELDSYRNLTERERTDFLSGDKNNDHFYKRSQTTTPIDSTPAKKPAGSLPQLYKTAGSKASLLSMWCVRMDAIAASRHEEFEGRSSASGSQAELYTDLSLAETNSARSTPVGSEWNMTS